MRRSLDARTLVLAAAALFLALSNCGRREELSSEGSRPASTADRHVESPAVSASNRAPGTGRSTSREPDWGLDPLDPARDYVGRYLRATKRYGDQTVCVVVGDSKFTSGRSIVESRNDPSGKCGAAGEVRDRFFVSVTTDHLSLDETLHQPKLQTWPDGSDPEGPPKGVVDIQDLRAWKTGLRDAFHRLQLAPLRVQLYGRGTYPVVSIAGWHAGVQQTMSPGQLEAPAKELCAANDGEPLAVFAALDRTTLLRITCPGSARFEAL
jgi:hypothetical protein